jgi:hypothetical protein
MLKQVLFLFWAIFSTTVYADLETRSFLLQSISSRSELSTRVSAVKSLKELVGNSDVSRSLLKLAGEVSQNIKLRQEAFSSLVPVSRSSRISRTLLSIYKKEQNVALKVSLLRSLWLAASTDQTVRRFIQKILLNSQDANDSLRQAAAFALQATINSSRAARPLTNIIQNANNSIELRVQALKSLFFYKHNNIVERLFKALAYDESEKEEVRVTALKLLMGHPSSSTKRRYLIDLSRRTYSDVVRNAAIDALRLNYNQQDIRYFHLFKNPKTGDLRDPLLDES